MGIFPEEFDVLRVDETVKKKLLWTVGLLKRAGVDSGKSVVISRRSGDSNLEITLIKRETRIVIDRINADTVHLVSRLVGQGSFHPDVCVHAVGREPVTLQVAVKSRLRR